jgi:hypothetical protein
MRSRSTPRGQVGRSWAACTPRGRAGARSTRIADELKALERRRVAGEGGRAIRDSLGTDAAPHRPPRPPLSGSQGPRCGEPEMTN